MFDVSKGTGGGIAYSWQQLPSGSSGSGTFNASGTFTLNALPAGATIELKLGPDNLDRFFIAYHGDAQRLTQVKQWGTANWTSFEFAFQFCYNLDVTATDKPNLSKNNIRLTSMFSNCSSLIGNSSFGSWITSNVASMSSMFESNYNFNQDIGNWNTENVVYMYNMFSHATSFNQDIGNWNTEKVEDMSNMFWHAEAFNNASPGNWTLNSVVNLSGIFDDSGLDCNRYGLILRGWANNENPPFGLSLGAANLKYGSDYSDDRDILADYYEWTITDAGELTNCQPLAAVFGGLNAYLENGKLFVNWATLSEKNNHRFEIEASNDGKNFIKIGEIISKAKDGNSSENISYDFSTSANGLGLAGFAIFGLAVGAGLLRRKRLMIALMAASIMVLGYACTKSDKEAVPQSDNL